MQRVRVGKASEQAGHHLDLLQVTKVHIECQYLDAWNHGAWTCHCVRLQAIRLIVVLVNRLVNIIRCGDDRQGDGKLDVYVL